ncbi:MAG: MBL fold metallo-hydrolase RNA specificity domain-containing protein, partial [Nanoarchaeota archaeon]|nr:MBL fold metallo-hydrolase RNA specificity domain-containing protein [Nanoarchaeota archaeon]
KALNRRLVLDAKLAYLSHYFGLKFGSGAYPRLNDVIVYLDRKKSRNKAIEWEESREEYRESYEKDLIQLSPNVLWGHEGRRHIRQNAFQYVFCTSNATDKIIDLTEGEQFPFTFILSKSEPFNEEMAITYNKMLQWLAMHKIQKFYRIHTSGHCSSEELKQVLHTANPKTIYPIHTKNPQAFCNLVPKGTEVIFPKGAGYE